MASDFNEYEFNKVYLRKGIKSQRGMGRGSEIGKDLEPWTWSKGGKPGRWKRGIWGQKLRSWKKLLEEKAKEKNIEIISIIIRKGRILVIGDEIMFADIKKIPNGRCMCKFKCPCGAIDIKIVRDLCYGQCQLECHNCSERKRRVDIQASHLNFDNKKKAYLIKKREETNIKKIGYPYPVQNPEIARKCFDNMRKSKIYIFPSGRKVKVQGYEPQCLNDLIFNEHIDENDIKVAIGDSAPTIIWNDDNGKEHTHYPDIFIVSQNKLIDAKSDYILKERTKGPYKKQEAAKKMGYKYEIRVYNEKGDLIERHN